MCVNMDEQPEYLAAWCCLEPRIAAHNGGLCMLPLSLHASQADTPPKETAIRGDVVDMKEGDVVLFTSRYAESSPPYLVGVCDYEDSGRGTVAEGIGVRK